ncbi:transcription/translation regulatory transformer protein RfaH [Pseudohalioglobus sediminis]|nr:transcription/translation regulatory transformer protein RfaH [Pseudohalioglobus sediminis]
MPSHWYTVQSKPRQENLARQNLDRQGFTTYLPLITQRKRRRNQWTQVTEPLFPRYLFIHVDPSQQSLAPVRSTLGVSQLVRFGQLLRPVPDAVIDYLRAMETADTGAREDHSPRYQPGDRVEILEGPFAGLSGVYQMQDSDHRALLLVELLGRSNPVTVELDALSA